MQSEYFISRERTTQCNSGSSWKEGKWGLRDRGNQKYLNDTPMFKEFESFSKYLEIGEKII